MHRILGLLVNHQSSTEMDCQTRLFENENSVERSMEQTWDGQLRAKKMELFTSKYYAACAVGGMISSGSVHFLVTPFDMLKVNMQVSLNRSCVDLFIDQVVLFLISYLLTFDLVIY